MELTPYLIGALIGAVLAFAFLYLLFKSKTVERREYDQLASKLNDITSSLKLAEERLKSNLELTSSLEQRAELKQNEFSALLAKNASIEASMKITTERFNEHSAALQKEKEVNRDQQNELNLHQRQVAELRAQNISLLEKLDAQKNEMIEIQKRAHLEFERLAQQIFEEKTGKFTEANKSNMEALLRPLAENIDSFKKKVEETYDKESKQRFSLEEKVKDLITNTTKISEEANNLATALKGQVKKQGDWGETILERILESSGLEKGREYFIQENIKDEEGKNYRPDVIVRLPDNKKIIVDSKVSLNAYLRYSETDSPEEKAIQAAKHLQAINTHIDQLSSKKYHESENSLDWVIMFFAIEPAYILAVQEDPNLWSYAYSRKVILINPTSLIATLRIIADMWKIEQQNKNAKAIADQGTRLYEKFVGFVKTLEEIGRHITKSQDAYNEAMGQLKDGRGNLIKQAQNLKKLGIKSAKNLPTSFQAADDEEDEVPGLEGGEQAESGD